MNAKTTANSRGFRSPLAAAGGAHRLIEQARRLEAARAAIANALPRELASGWQLARLDQDALVIVTDSAARATRLRYARSAVLNGAQKCLGGRPKTLSVKLTPPTGEPRRQSRARLTPAAAASLRQAIQGMEDGRLRQALAKLARRAENES
jgi:hypothetical protein